MKRVVKLPDVQTIRTEAAQWAAKLDAGNLQVDDLIKLRSWVSQSKVHREELEATAAAWDRMDILSVCESVFARPGRTRLRKLWLRGAIAAGLFLFAFTLYLVTNQLMHRDSALFTAYFQTRIGEQRTILLPDGSNVQMNTASELRVNFNGELRQVYLDDGEAFFSVTRDARRPFVVETRLGSVTAIGTAFSVRVDTPVVEVTVSEGVVRLDGIPQAGRAGDSKLRTDSRERVTVSAGQTASFDAAIQSLESLGPNEMVKKLAWRDGMIRFEGEPLSRVLEEHARYSTTDIQIADPTLRQLRIGGYFRAGDTKALLASLEDTFGIRVEHSRDGAVYLYSSNGQL